VADERGAEGDTEAAEIAQVLEEAILDAITEGEADDDE
jgi:hypothetical protein